jgi:hypothetical protein
LVIAGRELVTAEIGFCGRFESARELISGLKLPDGQNGTIPWGGPKFERMAIDE